MNEPKVWDLDYINFLLATPRVVSGINLVSLVWSDDTHAIPCDYRLFDAPNDGLTKNDHFREMLATARRRGFTPEYVCFANWYSIRPALQ